MGNCKGCSKGFGDTLEFAIKKATFGKIRQKKGCGCEKRKHWLNERFPYNKGLLGKINK
jgi:hypothetical protein